MKLSLAWIFDHINADWQKVDIAVLVDKFNKTAAEIESVQKVSIDLKKFALGEVVATTADTCTVEIKEWKKKIDLPFRDDATAGACFLVKKSGDNVSWAMLTDFFCGKDGFFPALHVAQDLRAGEWKKELQAEDYILEIDNKTITHRPDMWSHRGFAREIAAIFDFEFLPLKQFVVSKKIEEYDSQAPASKDNPISISLKDQNVGKRFAGLYLDSVVCRSSDLWMALRLAVTGNRPIDFIIDATNYVMLDIGQPMHAFDAGKLKMVEARLAKKGEKLTLLDGQEIELTKNDYVITDGKKPISLAGVMGGKDSGESHNSTALFLESANFDATTIRRTAARFKIRTEASARFEKTLDPNQNTDAILRFLRLCDDAHIQYKASDTIHSVGKKIEPITITLSHEFLCARLGAQPQPDFVVRTLEKIGFSVKKLGDEYHVTVPTFRCSKDVTIAEDLVEEVGRFFGYENIDYVLPEKKLEPSDLGSVMRVRKMKNLFAYSLQMKEVYNYSLYDESFLKEINIDAQGCIQIKNPLSENWLYLVDSLIPHLLKNVQQNVAENESIRFFEWGRTWKLDGKEIEEKKSLAGIIFERKKNVDFYDAKALLARLFHMLELDVKWNQVSEEKLPEWAAPYQTAQLFHEKKQIGFAGKINQAMLENISEGDAFVFELDGDALLSYEVPVKKYKPASKYPSVHRDVSVLVPLSVTVDQISEAISFADKRVKDVELVDFFQKSDWKDKKSLTMRFVIQDSTKTLTSQEADSVYAQIVKKLEKLGATVR